MKTGLRRRRLGSLVLEPETPVLLSTIPSLSRHAAPFFCRRKITSCRGRARSMLTGSGSAGGGTACRSSSGAALLRSATDFSLIGCAVDVWMRQLTFQHQIAKLNTQPNLQPPCAQEHCSVRPRCSPNNTPWAKKATAPTRRSPAAAKSRTTARSRSWRLYGLRRRSPTPRHRTRSLTRCRSWSESGLPSSWSSGSKSSGLRARRRRTWRKLGSGTRSVLLPRLLFRAPTLVEPLLPPHLPLCCRCCALEAAALPVSARTRAPSWWARRRQRGTSWRVRAWWAAQVSVEGSTTTHANAHTPPSPLCRSRRTTSTSGR